jgi:hypothetical protein
MPVRVYYAIWTPSEALHACALLKVEVPDLDLHIGRVRRIHSTFILGSLEGPYRLEAASKPFHGLFQFNILHHYAAEI